MVMAKMDRGKQVPTKGSNLPIALVLINHKL